LDRCPLRYLLAGLHRGLKLDLTSSQDRVFRQTIRQSPDNSDSIDLCVCGKQHFQSYDSLDTQLASFARVARLWSGCDFRFCVDFLWCKTCDLAVVENKCERAVCGAAIVLVLFGSDVCFRRQRWCGRRRWFYFRRRKRSRGWLGPPAGLSESRSSEDQNEE